MNRAKSRVCVCAIDMFYRCLAHAHRAILCIEFANKDISHKE